MRPCCTGAAPATACMCACNKCFHCSAAATCTGPPCIGTAWYRVTVHDQGVNCAYTCTGLRCTTWGLARWETPVPVARQSRCFAEQESGTHPAHPRCHIAHLVLTQSGEQLLWTYVRVLGYEHNAQHWSCLPCLCQLRKTVNEDVPCTAHTWTGGKATASGVA